MFYMVILIIYNNFVYVDNQIENLSKYKDDNKPDVHDYNEGT